MSHGKRRARSLHSTKLLHIRIASCEGISLPMINGADQPADVFMDEYTRDDIIARYISRTAGVGIDYVLTHVYAPIYSELLHGLVEQRPRGTGFRILEYGCGGGMNLLKVAQLVHSLGARLERAYGTDFSRPMIEAARSEAATHLPRAWAAKIDYVVARNETLVRDLADGTESSPSELYESFDFILGVNTFRYTHRLKREADCARDIHRLLRPGGYSVMIDMNRLFPLFRSRIRDVLTRPSNEYYIPSLKDYVRPFANAGFVIKEARNFCWIPHSANTLVLAACKTLTPVLEACFSPFAMRSLVVAQKPA